MDLGFLENFHDLVLSGSVRKLSEVKGIPIGTISRQLSTLERELGHTLLERKQGVVGVTLTRQGQVLFNALPGILGAYENAKNLMNDDPNVNKGDIRIFAPGLMIEDWFVPMLPKFLEQHPSFTLNFIHQNEFVTDEMRKRMIVVHPKSAEIPDVVQVELLDFHFSLWASTPYLERHGRPKALADLSHHRLVVFSKDGEKTIFPCSSWHIKDLWMKSEDLICINSKPGIIKAAEEGVGIISVPEEAIHARKVKLERVLPEIKGPSVTMCLSYPTYLQDNKIIMILKEFLIEQFSLLEKN